MTEKYTSYLKLLATRDLTMVMLTIMAVGVVLTYLLYKNFIPSSLKRFEKQIHAGVMICGLALYVTTLIVLASTPLSKGK